MQLVEKGKKKGGGGKHVRVPPASLSPLVGKEEKGNKRIKNSTPANSTAHKKSSEVEGAKH